MVDIEQCSGSKSTGGKHIQINNLLRTKRVMPLVVIVHEAYSGNVEEWFQDFISTEGVTHPIDNCWRNDMDSKTSPCTGKRKDITDLVVSLPVIFILEVSEPQNLLAADAGHWKTPAWNFPKTLLPSTKQMADEIGLIYDLVGLALFSPGGSHFVARYISQDHSAIFDYDGMQHNGSPVLNKTAKIGTDITRNLPQGFHVHQALYRLRGGVKAQDQFFQIQCQAYEEKFNLQMSSKLVDVLPAVSYMGDDLVKYWPPNQETVRKSKTEYLSLTAPDISQGKDRSKNLTVKVPLYVSSRSTPESEDETTGPTKPATANSPSSSISSLPNSPFPLKCICGLYGDGNVSYDHEAGVAIQCNDCHNWSHVACQRDGRASDLAEKDHFICDFCDLERLLPSKSNSRRSLRQ